MTNLGHCTARQKALFQIQMAAQDALRDEEIHNAEDGQQGKHHADKQVEHAWRAHAGRELNKEAAERLKLLSTMMDVTATVSSTTLMA